MGQCEYNQFTPGPVFNTPLQWAYTLRREVYHMKQSIHDVQRDARASRLIDELVTTERDGGRIGWFECKRRAISIVRFNKTNFSLSPSGAEVTGTGQP